MLRSKDQIKVLKNSAQTSKQAPMKSILLQDIQAHLIPSLLLPWCSSGNSLCSTGLHHPGFASSSPPSSGYYIWSRRLCTQVIVIRTVPLSYISRSHSFYFKVWPLVLFWIPHFHFFLFSVFSVHQILYEISYLPPHMRIGCLSKKVRAIYLYFGFIAKN